jgi:hypothetical protein
LGGAFSILAVPLRNYRVELAALIGDVLFKNFQWRSAGGNDAVCAMPQNWFPVKAAQMLRVFSAQFPGRNRFESVYQAAGLNVRGSVNEKMHMVRLAIHLHKLAIVRSADFLKNKSHIPKHGVGKSFATVLRHKNYVVVGPKNTMCVCSQLLCHHVNYIILPV